MKRPIRVVILSNQTLLVEGVITRLKQYRDRVELHSVDFRHPNLLAHITELQPAAIILDDKDPLVVQVAPLDKLIRALPTIKVIRLNTRSFQAQVIQSDRYCVAEVCDLLELIEPGSPEATELPKIEF